MRDLSPPRAALAPPVWRPWPGPKSKFNGIGGLRTYLSLTYDTEALGVSARHNERSSAVGQRNVRDNIRRCDLGGWAVVYRKQVREAYGHPSRTNRVGAVGSANLPQ
jgi:hypothetical protein